MQGQTVCLGIIMIRASNSQHFRGGEWGAKSL